MTSSGKLDALCLLGRWDAVDPTLQRPVGVRSRGSLERPERNGFEELTAKMGTLDEGTALDACCWKSQRTSSADVIRSVADASYTPESRGTCTLFRTLYTNACSFDCAYCINSTHSREEYSYKPEELAQVFQSLYVRGTVQGLFLTSSMGVDPGTTMEGMIQAVETLRVKHAFDGYVHLKILPGASRDHVRRAVQLADRVSLNVEEPSGSRLAEVCTVKDYEVDVLRRQAWVKELAPHPPSGQVTQFIVGAAEETDREIITRMSLLYEEMKMRRVYYSAFEPVPETGLQSRPAAPSWRQHRLYQVDWLYRVYRYPAGDILEALTDDSLPNKDPKVTLARLLLDQPIEVNEAVREELLRVPGIGPLSARRILSLRSKGVKIQSRRQLVELGVVLHRAQPFLKIGGSRQPTLKDWFDEGA